jgi:hypothetical protein
LHHVKPKFQYSSTHPKPIAFFSPSPASYANPISSGLASRVIFIKLHRRKNLHTLNDKIGFNSTFTHSQEKLRLKKQTLSETADKFSVMRRNKEMCLRKIQTTFGRDPVLDNKIGKSMELKILCGCGPHLQDSHLQWQAVHRASKQSRIDNQSV